MSDLQGEQTKTDASVVRARRQPVHLMTTRQQPALRATPEAHVMALAGIAVNLLLVGKVLPPTK